MASWVANDSWQLKQRNGSSMLADPFLMDLERKHNEESRSEAWATLLGSSSAHSHGIVAKSFSAFDPWARTADTRGGNDDGGLDVSFNGRGFREMESCDASSDSQFTSASKSDGGSSSAVDQLGDYDRDRRAAIDFVLELAGPPSTPPLEVVAGQSPSAVVAICDLPLPAFTTDRSLTCDDWSPRMAELAGWTDGDVISMREQFSTRLFHRCTEVSSRADDLLRSALFSFSAANSSLASVLSTHTATAPSCAASFWMSRKSGDFVRVQLHAAPRHNADGTVAGVVCVVLQEAEALPARPPPDEPVAAAAGGCSGTAAASLVDSRAEVNEAKHMEKGGEGRQVQPIDEVADTALRCSQYPAAAAAPPPSSPSPSPSPVAVAAAASGEPLSSLPSHRAMTLSERSRDQPVHGDCAVQSLQSGHAGRDAAVMAFAAQGGVGEMLGSAVEGFCAAMSSSREGFGAADDSWGSVASFQDFEPSTADGVGAGGTDDACTAAAAAATAAAAAAARAAVRRGRSRHSWDSLSSSTSLCSLHGALWLNHNCSVTDSEAAEEEDDPVACSPLRSCTTTPTHSRTHSRSRTHRNALGSTPVALGLSPLHPNQPLMVTVERSATCGHDSSRSSRKADSKAAVVRSLATSFSVSAGVQRTMSSTAASAVLPFTTYGALAGAPAAATTTTAATAASGAFRGSLESTYTIPSCLPTIHHRALVAASMASVRDEVAHLLERCGLTVVCAASLEEVVWRFNSSLLPTVPGEQQFSLVLLELEAAVRDGLGCIRKMRQLEAEAPRQQQERQLGGSASTPHPLHGASASASASSGGGAMDARSLHCQRSSGSQCHSRPHALRGAAGGVAGWHRHSSMPDLRCFSPGAGSSSSGSSSSSGWDATAGGALLHMRCSSSLVGSRARGERLDVVEEDCEGCWTPQPPAAADERQGDEEGCTPGGRGGSAGGGGSSSSSSSDAVEVDVRRSLRGMPQLQRTPPSSSPVKRTAIIAMANMNRWDLAGLDSAVEQCVRAGVDAVLPRTIPLPQLRQVLRKLGVHGRYLQLPRNA